MVERSTFNGKTYYDIDTSSYLAKDPGVFLDDFVKAVEGVLRYWIDIHTDRDTWAANWLIGYSPKEMLEQSPIIENSYFSFNWLEAAFEHTACKLEGHWKVCRNCGMMDEYPQVCCDSPEYGVATRDEIAEGLVIYDATHLITDTAAWEALRIEGFDKYTDEVYDVFAPALEEMRESLFDMEEAKASGNPYELLAATMQATQLYHVNGEVIDDYSDYVELSPSLVDDVRNDGYKETFGEEEVEDFLTRYAT